MRIYGQLGETEKPLVVSAILLALDDKENEDLIETLKGKDTKTDGKLLFEALEISLKNSKISSEKREIILNQFTLIKDRKILSKKHKDLGKTPLKYFTEFIKEKIYDKIKNFKSPADVLGNFYGEFMRYSGGDGKSLGIVLTPHHITELFCELAELNINDIVFDPCCGTGGFLISAMHSLITKANNKKEIEHIKLNQIHGIEIREDMFSIATTNMILRGDGKSNLIRNDFLDMNSDKFIDKKFTVGFLNPPYALREGKNTAHLSEIHFVEHLLDSLTEKGRGVVIVPTSAMTGKYKEDAEAKKRILKKHTLEGVITLNTNTFYRIGVNACIAVFTSHVPHDSNKYCKFINFKNDGYEIHKNIGLIKTERAKEKKKHLLDCWLRDSPSDNNYMVKSKIKDSDDWLHSFYYFNDDIPSKASFEKTMLNYLRFEFNLILNDKLKNNPKENINIHDCCDFKDIKWKEFRIEDIFTISGTKTTHVSELMNKNDYDNEFPYITTKSKNNGVDGFYNYFTEKGNVITVDSATDGNIFYQEMNFSASDHVEKLTPKFKMNRYSALFIVSSLSFSTKNKYDYGYKFSQHRLKRQTLLLPVKNKNIDYTFMENYMHNLEYTFLNKYFKFFNKEI